MQPTEIEASIVSTLKPQIPKSTWSAMSALAPFATLQKTVVTVCQKFVKTFFLKPLLSLSHHSIRHQSRESALHLAYYDFCQRSDVVL
jgi:hypothetical protein